MRGQRAPITSNNGALPTAASPGDLGLRRRAASAHVASAHVASAHVASARVAPIVEPPPFAVALAAGSRHLRASASGALVVAGIQRFEQALQLVLGRSPAGTAPDELQLASLQRRLTVEVLRAATLELAAEATNLLPQLRLFDDGFCGVSTDAVPAFDVRAGEDGTDKCHADAIRSGEAGVGTKGVAVGGLRSEPEELGELLESLLALTARHKQGRLRYLPSQQRKQRGMFYTPRAVVNSLVERAVEPWLSGELPLPKVCDPSLGGGAFLLGAARELLRARSPAQQEPSTLRREIALSLYGFDIEPLAIAVAEAAIAIWGGLGADELSRLQRQLTRTDSMEVRPKQPFELVIGNPPWVAYAGRATQPLTQQRRNWMAKEYQAFHGYPTLHACFVELAARLAPSGRIALLVPSPIADLDGYRPMRRVLTRTHRVHHELVEYGQDAFDGVVQPCFGLIADADATAVASELPLALVERSGVGSAAARVEPPTSLERLSSLARLPAECFREFGFQTTSEVTSSMLLRGAEPKPPYDYPLLQGREVAEFVVGRPSLYLKVDREKLKRLHCRLRELSEYHQVEFLVRQTAKYTIAALHNGLPFRNSLLAGFGVAPYSAAVLVGLLNSTLIRSLHLAGQRDARQKTFPQVKVGHLRALPAPPTQDERATQLERLVFAIQNRQPSASERHELNALVYAWYGVLADDAAVIDRFYADRAK